jgi:lipopolysaccharide biosynthesis regulator YciM
MYLFKEKCMSGGSQNYLYLKVQDVAGNLFDNVSDINSLQKQKLKEIYQEMSDFMKTIEWIESGDYGTEKINEAIEAFRNKINQIV